MPPPTSMTISAAGRIVMLAVGPRQESLTPILPRPAPKAWVPLPNAGPTSVVMAATASPYRACLPTSPQSTLFLTPSTICQSWASSEEPGMNSIWMAVLRTTILDIEERRTVVMMVRVVATRSTASSGAKNASAAAMASSVIMKMNMMSAWRSR